jgi:hypothetical protein
MNDHKYPAHRGCGCFGLRANYRLLSRRPPIYLPYPTRYSPRSLPVKRPSYVMDSP